MRVETIADLVMRLESLFSAIGLQPNQMSDNCGHGVIFTVPGKAKVVMESLMTQTGLDAWMYEGGNAFSGCEAENWSLYLSSASGGLVLCLASVSSLHKEYLDRHNPSPAEQAMTREETLAKAEQGDPQAQCDIGQYLLDENDDAKAVFWFRKAADQGFADGLAALARLYLYGTGVPQDVAEGVAWVRKAAEQGDDGCQIWLGEIYEEGRGVAQDYVQAEQWYRRAADQGHQRAARLLRSLRRTVKRLERETAAQSVQKK
jgi:hypothetical protein